MASLEQSLLAWVNLFAGADFSVVNCLSDLYDGNHILFIARQIFPSTTITQKKSHTHPFESVSELLKEFFFTQYNCEPKILTFEHDVEKLLVLLLSAAVHCEDRANFIRGITCLDSPVQLTIMSVIEATMQTITTGDACPRTPARTEMLFTDSPLPSSACPAKSPTSAKNDELKMRRELSKTCEELEEFKYLYEESVQEMRKKNKMVDELSFRVQSLSKSADRVAILEDEIEGLRNTALKVDKYEAEAARMQSILSEARATVDAYHELQKDHNECSTLSDRLAREITTLEVRLKEYRIKNASMDVELVEQKASNERQKNEISRMALLNHTTEQELMTCKMELQDIKSRLIQMEEGQKTQSYETATSESQNMVNFLALQKENADIKSQLEKYKDLELQAMLWDDRISDLSAIKFQLEKKTLQLAEELDSENFKCRQMVEKFDVQNKKMEQMQFQIAQFSGGDASSKKKFEVPQDPVKRKTLSDEDSSSAVQGPIQSKSRKVWHSEEPDVRKIATYNDPKDDPNRGDELRRRNAQTLPHLRSSYAVELNTANPVNTSLLDIDRDAMRQTNLETSLKFFKGSSIQEHFQYTGDDDKNGSVVFKKSEAFTVSPVKKNIIKRAACSLGVKTEDAAKENVLVTEQTESSGRVTRKHVLAAKRPVTVPSSNITNVKDKEVSSKKIQPKQAEVKLVMARSGVKS